MFPDGCCNVGHRGDTFGNWWCPMKTEKRLVCNLFVIFFNKAQFSSREMYLQRIPSEKKIENEKGLNQMSL